MHIGLGRASFAAGVVASVVLDLCVGTAMNRVHVAHFEGFFRKTGFTHAALGGPIGCFQQAGFCLRRRVGKLLLQVCFWSVSPSAAKG